MSSSLIINDKKLVDLPLEAGYQVVQLEGNSVGRDDLFAAITSGVADPEYLDDANSQFTPVADLNTRPHMEEEIDIPVETGSGVFGKKAQVKIGHQGPTLLGDVSIHYKITVDSANAAANCELVPFIAEYLLGENFRIQYANNTIRQYSREVQHLYGRVMNDDRGYADSAYRQRVGAHEVDRTIVASTAQVFEFSVPLWQPFKQMANRYDHMFVAGGHADELVYSWTIPSFESIFRAAAPLGDGSYGFTLPAASTITMEVSARAKFMNVLKAERTAHITKVQSNGGISRTILSPEVQEAEIAGSGVSGGTIAGGSTVLQARTLSAAAGAVENLGKIDLKNLVNPCALLAFMVRFVVDTEAATSSSADAGSIPRPDWTCAQPYKKYHLRENGKRFLVEHSMKQVREDEWPRYLNSRPVDGIGIISFCEHPTLQNFGGGHITPSTMNNPQLWITMSNRPLEERSRTATNGTYLSAGAVLATGESYFSNSATALAPDSTDPWQRSFHNVDADYADDTKVLNVDFDANENTKYPAADAHFNKQVFILSFARNKLHSERSETLEYYRS